jgi:hypothetical protein
MQTKQTNSIVKLLSMRELGTNINETIREMQEISVPKESLIYRNTRDALKTLGEYELASDANEGDSEDEEEERQKGVDIINNIFNADKALMLFSREEEILFGAIKPSLSFKYLDENKDIFSNEEIAGVSEESKVIGISLKLNFLLNTAQGLANAIKDKIEDTTNAWYENKEHDVILHIKENANFLSSDRGVEKNNSDLEMIRKIATYEAPELEDELEEVEIFFNDLPSKKEMIKVLENIVKVIYSCPELLESATNENFKNVATHIVEDINNNAKEDALLIPIEEKSVKLNDILPKILHTAQAESVLELDFLELNLENNQEYFEQIIAARKVNAMNLKVNGECPSVNLTNENTERNNNAENNMSYGEPEIKKQRYL